jgi:hypothetical protein
MLGNVVVEVRNMLEKTEKTRSTYSRCVWKSRKHPKWESVGTLVLVVTWCLQYGVLSTLIQHPAAKTRLCSGVIQVLFCAPFPSSRRPSLFRFRSERRNIVSCIIAQQPLKDFTLHNCIATSTGPSPNPTEIFEVCLTYHSTTSDPNGAFVAPFRPAFILALIRLVGPTHYAARPTWGTPIMAVSWPSSPTTFPHETPKLRPETRMTAMLYACILASDTEAHRPPDITPCL